jgi:hypothetical protein
MGLRLVALTARLGLAASFVSFGTVLFVGEPVVLAQTTNGIFVTPVGDAPFSGVIDVERSEVRPDGSVVRLKTLRDVARDNRGRIYNVFRQLVPANSSDAIPVERIHFYDPETRAFTYLYPQQHVYVTGTVRHPPAAEPADMAASATGRGAPLNQFTKEEDLGMQQMAGVSAHGVREIQTIPAGESSAGKEVVLTDEYWYSEELHMNVKVAHSDPRAGSVTMTLIRATRAEPDAALFRIPEGYHAMNPNQQANPNSGTPDSGK